MRAPSHLSFHRREAQRPTIRLAGPSACGAAGWARAAMPGLPNTSSGQPDYADMIFAAIDGPAAELVKIFDRDGQRAHVHDETGDDPTA